MKLLALLAILLLFGAAFAACTNIVACQVINTPACYDINLNLSGVNDASCINVTASDVSITCLGAAGLSYQTITGTNTSNTFGIWVNSASNDVNISNCLVQNYSTNIQYQDADNGNLNNDTMIGQYNGAGAVSAYDLNLKDANNTVVNGSNFQTNSSTEYGTSVGNAANGIIENNTGNTTSNSASLVIMQGTDNNFTIWNNSFNTSGTVAHVIYLTGTQTNMNISQNMLNESGSGDGVAIAVAAINVTVFNNTINATSTGFGVDITSQPSNVTIAQNNIQGVGTAGIRDNQGGSNINITNNTIKTTTGQGFLLSGGGISNMSISFNNINTTTGIGISNTNTVVNLSVLNNNVNTTTGVTIDLATGNTMDNYTIDNNHLNASNPGQVVLFNAANNVTFANNTINTTTGGTGISIAPSSVQNCSYNTIANNTIHVAGSVIGIGLVGSTTKNVTFNTIFNNTVTTGASNSENIEISGNGSDVINNSITYNQLLNCTSLCLYIVGGQNNTYAENNITDAGAFATVDFASTASYNEVVVNNTLNTSNSGIGVSILIGGANNVIANNTINATTGISVSPPANTVFTSASFLNNTINSSTSAIVFSGGGNQANVTNSIIANNTIVVSGGYGIEFTNGASTRYFQNNVITNNTINTSGSTAWAIYLTENLTNITFNTINASGVTAQGINLSGTGNDIITNNTIWVNTTAPGTAIRIGAFDKNDSIYWNNFTGGAFFINDSNGSNYYNTTVAGIAEGNIYANATTYSTNAWWTTSNSNNWANGGTKYPANATNTPGIFTANTPFPDNDSGPWINQSGGGGCASGLTSLVGGPTIGGIWECVQAGNVILRGGPLMANTNWSVWNQGDGVKVLNGSSAGASWVPE